MHITGAKFRLAICRIGSCSHLANPMRLQRRNHDLRFSPNPFPNFSPNFLSAARFPTSTFDRTTLNQDSWYSNSTREHYGGADHSTLSQEIPSRFLASAMFHLVRLYQTGNDLIQGVTRDRNSLHMIAEARHPGFASTYSRTLLSDVFNVPTSAVRTPSAPSIL